MHRQNTLASLRKRYPQALHYIVRDEGTEDEEAMWCETYEGERRTHTATECPYLDSFDGHFRIVPQRPAPATSHSRWEAATP